MIHRNQGGTANIASSLFGAEFFLVHLTVKTVNIKFDYGKKESTMKDQLEKIKQEALRQIEASDALEKLNDIKVAYLGKKG